MRYGCQDFARSDARSPYPDNHVVLDNADLINYI